MSSISIADEMSVSVGALDLAPTKADGSLPAIEPNLAVDDCAQEIADARLYLAGMTHFFSDRS